MTLTIREMYPEDYDRKGYVHYQSWLETYSGLIPDHILANQTLEKCQSIARRWPDNTLVLELDGKIVGFSGYSKNDFDTGEVIAIYLLKEVQGLGLGRTLMDATIAKLADCSSIVLWVLKGNDHAIGFYQHYGFRFNEVEKTAPVGTELQMYLM